MRRLFDDYLRKKPLSMKVYVIMYLIRCCFRYVFLSVCDVSLKENYQFYLGKAVRNPKFHI